MKNSSSQQENMGTDVKIRPYARLITMLGDQLIKSNDIALIELIKNSYDADASHVNIDFVNFNEDYSNNPDSKIIIKDDGCGMNREIIEKHWLNPATSEKLRRKKIASRTQKGRVLQGEKGIGRFAAFKLGSSIKLITRRQIIESNNHFLDLGEDVENIAVLDFSNFDENFVNKEDKDMDLFLDELDVKLYQQSPINIKKNEKSGSDYGTIIEISNLKGAWSNKMVDKVKNEVNILRPISSSKLEDQKDSELKIDIFDISFSLNGNAVENKVDYDRGIQYYIDNYPVFRVENGKYVESEKAVYFNLNSIQNKILLNEDKVKALKVFKDYNRKLEDFSCGDFGFNFYIFDFNASEDSKYKLDKTGKEIVKSHRIYLYRDGIRVLPYGDPDDDWLGLDILRGTFSLSSFPSNDQVVGFVYITQKGNPSLKDKTNREGLIDSGYATSDFKMILQIVLNLLRIEEYKNYLDNNKKKEEIDNIKKGKPLEALNSIKERFKSDKEVMSTLKKFENAYNKEKSVFKDRMEKTEDLAALGLSVETTSHDMMLFLSKANDLTESLVKDISTKKDLDKEYIKNQLTLIAGNLSMAHSQMKGMQKIYPSTRSRAKEINLESIANKVEEFYSSAFDRNGIRFSLDSISTPLKVKTTDAVLMQVLINLFDNSLYWLTVSDIEDKNVTITIDGRNNRMIFSDSGPGIREEDLPYIFEAFYSGKGINGRGLGLYISRQLLERYDYTIDIANFSKDKILNGANFVLEFSKE